MKHIILNGYLIDVLNVPPDDGGGRVIRLSAKDGSETIDLALTDDDYEAFVERGRRVSVFRQLPPDAA